MKISPSLLALSLAAAVALSACSKGDSSGTVKIGAASPLTGAQAHIGEDIRNGVQLGIEDLKKLIHDTLPIIFKTHKRGYNWLVPKFGNRWESDAEKMQRILICLSSKKMQIPCQIHKRVHAKPEV